MPCFCLGVVNAHCEGGWMEYQAGRVTACTASQRALALSSSLVALEVSLSSSLSSLFKVCSVCD